MFAAATNSTHGDPNRLPPIRYVVKVLHTTWTGQLPIPPSAHQPFERPASSGNTIMKRDNQGVNEQPLSETTPPQ
ncbi:hypothetical protein [Paenibacillus lautus]|uniref:hypothetical protein n=1 Tax=Paenibacillus lautus TaxID=1401 RepID=UPI002DBB54DE|nr:hypothetical protein [Paenibacillus lautus]MEC0253625.1 hypothetical protein [Paenibacillus lautus]